MFLSRSIRTKYLQIITLLFFVLSLVLQLDAADASKLKKNIHQKPESLLETRIGTAENLNDDHIKIDGKLDEEAWKRSTPLTGFIQNNPDEGELATEKTEVIILYSQDSLYIGVRAYDSEPDGIKSILARRDSKLPSDWINIWIDSYHDHRSAFQFSVNPAGVERDVYWSDERKQDDDWDAVWDVEVSLDQLLGTYSQRGASICKSIRRIKRHSRNSISKKASITALHSGQRGILTGTGRQSLSHRVPIFGEYGFKSQVWIDQQFDPGRHI